MKLSDLAETLVDFKIVDPGKGSAFDDVDMRLLTMPNYESRLSKAFARTPYPFIVYAIHHPHDHDHWLANQSKYTNVMSPETIQQKYWPEYQHNPKAITLVLSNNFADNKHPLTPWIVAHRFVHSLESASGSGTRNSRWEAAVDNFELDMQQAYESAGFTLYDRKESWYEIVAAMTTGSARSNNRATTDRLHDGEAAHELMTQFIISGKITLDTSYIDNAKADLYTLELAQSVKDCIVRNTRKLNREAANDLSRAIGQVFVI